MRILILGGKGMAGHFITNYLQRKKEYEIFYTCRDINDKNGFFLDVTNRQELEELVKFLKPTIIINCTGILNHHAANNPTLAFHVNSLLPQQLKEIMEQHRGKLIQISTDCVFLGDKGDYVETDITDGVSVYSKSKQQGEIINDKHVTIRTSIIGPELKEDGIGLFQWFMKQNGKVKGYKKALWNGVTTLELAKAMDEIIKEDPSGLYHLCSPKKISKYDLLMLMKDVFEKEDIEIIPDESVVINRTLRNTRTDFQYHVPSYEDMLVELKDWLDYK
ncbi:dTDP-4-dehydrorhamnose reductase family protein [Evansella sp. AB-rgal1]|uniref:dTDP-4-dehydrorhamnose reductase family protein n=1 Tax=Evansella sp. AB-rgal1 TaxID=3242696 RepID=UPI00359E07F7